MLKDMTPQFTEAIRPEQRYIYFAGIHWICPYVINTWKFLSEMLRNQQPINPFLILLHSLDWTCTQPYICKQDNKKIIFITSMYCNKMFQSRNTINKQFVVTVKECKSHLSWLKICFNSPLLIHVCKDNASVNIGRVLGLLFRVL